MVEIGMVPMKGKTSFSSQVVTFPCVLSIRSPAVFASRVYLLDYDEAKRSDALRCFALADGKELWRYVSGFGAHILSAHTTSWQPTSKEDKMVWIKREMRPMPVKIHILLRHRKKDYAVQEDGTPNILIDDLKQNIDEWRAAGGIAIHHRSASDTIAKLKKLGFTEKKA